MNNQRRKFINKTGIVAASSVFAPNILLSTKNPKNGKGGELYCEFDSTSVRHKPTIGLGPRFINYQL